MEKIKIQDYISASKDIESKIDTLLQKYNSKYKCKFTIVQSKKLYKKNGRIFSVLFIKDR